MSDITLSKVVRQNLLSLQSTAELLNKTQERLSTGKKVNSALDNPINFFTSSGLQSRANDLSRLLDSVGNAVQTVAAADKGISAITKLIENAQATASQALTSAAPAVTYENEIAGTAAIVADTEATATGTVDVSTPVDLGATYDGDTVTITVGGVATTLTINTTDLSDSDELVAAINAIDGISATEIAGGFIEIVADDNETEFSVAYSDAGIATDIGLAADTYSPTNTDITAFTGDTLSVQVGAATATDITFTSRYDLLNQINALTGITAEFNGDDELVITSTLAADITLGGDALAELGLAAGPHEATATVATPSTTRTSAQASFNELLVQITQLAQDASFNGVNLLNSDNLTVVFNEDGSSTLAIAGVDFTATGLGLTTQTGDAFQTNAGVNAAIDELDAATATLRAQASTFGSNLSIVQARQDFSKNMISVLQIGADQLVLADSNEEGANMLALNTRQQLSTVALSLAAQADQNVLRLF
jgi:flagellin-like hook-associated protein FlgL